MKTLHFIVCLLLAIAPLGGLAAQADNPISTPKQGSPEAAFCADLDEEEEGLAEKLSGDGFFDRDTFDCEGDWWRAERLFAPWLLQLGEKKLRETAFEDGLGKIKTIAVRISVGSENVRSMTYFECRYRQDDNYGFELIALGGQVRYFESNPYINKRPRFWKLTIGRADCNFVLSQADEIDAYNIPSQAPFGDEIVVDGAASVTEYRDDDGYLYSWYRTTGNNLGDPAFDAERRIDSLLNYFAERAEESGRRLPLPAELQRWGS